MVSVYLYQCKWCSYCNRKELPMYRCGDICFNTLVDKELKNHFTDRYSRNLRGYIRRRGKIIFNLGIDATKEEVLSVITMTKLKYNCHKLKIFVRRRKS